jgi:hypothetical protein
MARCLMEKQKAGPIPRSPEQKMRIAQIAPLAESVPPKLYGGTERVVAWLTDELVGLGHDGHAICEWTSPASGTRDLAVRFDSKTNGTGALRQFVSKATRPSSRVAFCYLRSVLPVSSKGRLSARLPKIDGSHPVQRPLVQASWPNRFPSG